MGTIARRDIPALLAGMAMAAGGAARAASEPHQDEGLSFTAEAIHQEIAFGASAARIYATLLDAKQFDTVTRLGEAFKSGRLGKTPTAIDPVEGGAFELFGGYIGGRTLELVPDKRIAQAWREKSWPDGVFSLVTFAFSSQGAPTKLTLDHTGFPNGAGHHLSIGWYGDYWEPLRKYLG